MSQSAVSPNSSQRYYLRSAEDQARAFDAAWRHTKIVRLLKRTIIFGAAASIIGLAGYTMIDPFADVPDNVSISKATLNGSRITMEAPRLSGFRKDGRPYALKARSGVQDVRNPKIIELYDIEADITVDDKNRVKVTAPRGVFDSGGDLMELRTSNPDDTIRIASTSGYVINLKTAEINFKAGTMVSKRDVSVRLTNGTIAANSVKVMDNGKKITFSGKVRTVLQTPASIAAAKTRNNVTTGTK